jgi:polyisoprenoid-binding protein YceI
MFTVTHMGSGRYRAGFAELAARYDGDKGTLSGVVEVDALTISLPAFRHSMLSDRVFDAEQYPTIDFESRSLEADGHGRVAANGTMTIRGVSAHVVATGTVGPVVVDPWESERFGLVLMTRIDRRDFGITWAGEIPGGQLVAGFDVEVEVLLELIRAGSPSAERHRD